MVTQTTPRIFVSRGLTGGCGMLHRKPTVLKGCPKPMDIFMAQVYRNEKEALPLNIGCHVLEHCPMNTVCIQYLQCEWHPRNEVGSCVYIQYKYTGSPMTHWKCGVWQSLHLQISAAKMLSLWALAIILAVQAEALDLLTPPTLLGKPLLLPGQYRRSPPTPKGPSSVKNLLETSNPSCIPVAKYFMSSSKLNDCK